MMAGNHFDLTGVLGPRRQVHCTVCHFTDEVSVAAASREGWPKCHGYTMTIDSHAERCQ